MIHQPTRNISPTTMDSAHTDSRYDSFSLTGVPAARVSVRHTRQANPNPLGPRTFDPPNRNRDPIAFIRTTEKEPLGWYQDSLQYQDRYSWPVRYKSPFCFTPLAASRDRPERFGGDFLDNSVDNTIPISRHPLFTLPEVCVQNVLSYLDESDLDALALVDKDCRQLVRARRFHSVWINYSSASMALLDKLVDEASDRVSNKFPYDQPKWTLGACIHRISVAFEPESGRIKRPTTSSWVDQRRWSYDAVTCHQRHMNLLEIALRVALPNLDFLDWFDRIPLSQIMVNAIIHSRIRRLELHGVLLSEDFDLFGTTERERQGMEGHQLLLRRLVLDVGTGWSNKYCAPKFTSSLLRLVASSLEELVWEGGMFTSERPPQSHTLGTDIVCFKRLKKLQMTRVPLADDTVMAALIPAGSNAKLTHLILNSPEPKLGPFLASRGHISTLKHVSWELVTPYNDIDDFVSFVTANPQLEMFRTEDTTLGLQDDRLIPMFASSFSSLTSLAVGFNTAVIAPASLELIGSITTLKHLWLSSGIQWTIVFDWFVDHDSLRKHLAPLTQLEWFALTDDLYPNGNKHSIYQRPAKPQAWENSHSRLMSRHAMEFAMLHPQLEWVYLGQVAMQIERAEDGGEVVDAVPLSEKRVDCEWLLKELWGAERADWVFPSLF